MAAFVIARDRYPELAAYTAKAYGCDAKWLLTPTVITHLLQGRDYMAVMVDQAFHDTIHTHSIITASTSPDTTWQWLTDHQFLTAPPATPEIPERVWAYLFDQGQANPFGPGYCPRPSVDQFLTCRDALTNPTLTPVSPDPAPAPPFPPADGAWDSDQLAVLAARQHQLLTEQAEAIAVYQAALDRMAVLASEIAANDLILTTYSPPQPKK